MSFIGTCGHQVDKLEDLEVVRLKTEDCDPYIGFCAAVFYAMYCKRCAEEAKTWDEYLASDEEADEWLSKCSG